MASLPSSYQAKKITPFRWKPTEYEPSNYRRVFGPAILLILIPMLLVILLTVWAKIPSGPYVPAIFLSVAGTCAILLPPLLLNHYRRHILVEDEIQALHGRYQAGAKAFREKEGMSPNPTSEDEDRILIQLTDEFPDFVQIESTFREFLRTPNGEEVARNYASTQTLEQFKKDFVRSLIRGAAIENLEDTSYDLESYEWPIIGAMVTVALAIMFVSTLLYLGRVFPDGSLRLSASFLNIPFDWSLGGFLGAYFGSLISLLLRYSRGDLPPKAFAFYGLEITLGTHTTWILSSFLQDVTVIAPGVQLVFAFVVGSAAFQVLSWVRREVIKQLFGRHRTGGEGESLLLIRGITVEYANRLMEEGILEIQHLAFADPQKLSVVTRLDPEIIADWKGEAILRLYTDNAPLVA